MSTSGIYRSAAVVAVLLLVGSPLLAQEGHRHRMGPDSAGARSGMMGMMGQQGPMGRDAMMGHGGMMGMSPGMMMTRPSSLLDLAGVLGLSQEQQASLEELQADVRESHRTHMEAARAAHREARQLLEADAPDLEAYTETLQSAMSHMAQAHASMVRASVEARSLLNQEQQAQLETAERIMRTMHRMRGMGSGSPMGGRR